MKTQIELTIFLTIAFAISSIFLMAQNCTQCSGTSATGEMASAIGIDNTAEGKASFAGGIDSQALDKYSIAFGDSAKAWSRNSIALGRQVSVFGPYSFGVGKNVQTTITSSMIIGEGYDDDNPLINSNSQSLMIGFNSNKPTFFVKGAIGNGYTGCIGIGDVTDPTAKLHIKADDGEHADILLIPGTSKYAKIKFGEISTNNSPNRIEAKAEGNLKFFTDSDFVFQNGNVGIGENNPKAKLHVADGDIFIEDINSGIIMKSPDGQCWRGKLDNGGNLVFEMVDCDLLTAVTENNIEPEPLVCIFPNPAKEVITIEVTGFIGSLKAQLYNMNGKLAFAREISGTKIKLKTKGLQPGNYIIKIIGGARNVIHSEKIVLL